VQHLAPLQARISSWGLDALSPALQSRTILLPIDRDSMTNPCPPQFRRQTKSPLPTQTAPILKNKSGAKGAAKNPVWQEEERLGMNPVPGNLQGKST
jgi:hypothetical protein